MSLPTAPLTVDQFLDQRHELPEAGQWAELDRGAVRLLQPPDLDHGTAVLNLSKAFAAWTHSGSGGVAYACFDLGLIVARDPDSIWFPAVSVFTHGPRFAESDKLATATVPTLIVELASSADRRRLLADRIAAWQAWGVQEVWVIDPSARTLAAHPAQQPAAFHRSGDSFSGGEMLPGLVLPVAELFVEPAWWLGKPKRS